MRIIPAGKTHIEWITERANLIPISDVRGIAAESDTGEILGVCAMDTWTDGSVRLHIAIDNPVCMKNYIMIKEVFNYIFNTAGRLTAVGFVPGNNEKALRFDKKLGFKELARIKDGCRKGVDTVILELRKDDCKWIEDR